MVITLVGAACSEAPVRQVGKVSEASFAETTSNNDSKNYAEVRWTEHGIPHIKADSWEALGYGFAHAIASNAICVLAREFVTVREESRQSTLVQLTRI